MVLLALLMSVVAWADESTREGPDTQQSASTIYQVTDENGNTVFTDKPPHGSEAKAVQLNRTNTVETTKVPARKVAPAADNDDKKAPHRDYGSLTITSPENETTIRNPDEAVSVAVALTPDLQQGDRLVLFDNGIEQQSMKLSAPERGVHNLQVKVLGKNGEVLISSDMIEIYVHRSTVSDYESRDGILHRNDGMATVGGAADRGGAAKVGGAAQVGGAAPVGGAANRGEPAKRVDVISNGGNRRNTSSR
ncbi:hypothetical protein A11A3_01550 [Alcanivorax hongdengensis A-11-3]|uniref:DUF4124 domain-containing protein n=2 Tax=Alcanivorax hongdengensis TaxID=519051 RepID=L0WGY7_9GAMM|nr:hypothetical protein A11A3_01550 [Alcanivorax hongdengensis A-11-3]